MTTRELDRLAELERMMREASLQLLREEIRHGEALLELRDHPRKLWQRDPMFRTKSGGWKKRRSWNDFVVAQGLAESGKEADRLIDLYREHLMHRQLVRK